MVHWHRIWNLHGLSSAMLKRISAHKLLLILVIALIARPAMSVMAHDLAMGSSDTAIHCHDNQPEDCQMSSVASDAQQMNCDKCSDSCSSSLLAMVSGTSKALVLEHSHDLSSLSFVLSRRNDEPFRPPIHS